VSNSLGHRTEWSGVDFERLVRSHRKRNAKHQEKRLNVAHEEKRLNVAQEKKTPERCT
jgi:hypothetical protein